jgi:hypothetical protein
MARRLGVWGFVDGTDRMRRTSVPALVAAVCAVAFAALGRIPFSLPMPTHLVGAVCPTCGLTRGTVALARGDLALAFRYNPLSLVVPVVVAALGVRQVVGWTRGRWVNVRFRPSRLSWASGVVGLAVLWAYQQAHASFLMHEHSVTSVAATAAHRGFCLFG